LLGAPFGQQPAQRKQPKISLQASLRSNYSL
jgi:hypothetical protein